MRQNPVNRCPKPAFNRGTEESAVSSGLSRRAVVAGIFATSAAAGLAGCSTVPEQYANPAYVRTTVRYDTRETPGTIIVDPSDYYLYSVEKDGQALRYGVGVGAEEYAWSGVAFVHSKQEWPNWYPPAEMLQRQPEIIPFLSELEGGLGMPGGPNNPLGARALYLWQDNKPTLYRIHGTNDRWSIGQRASSGCIRMRNTDVIHLYNRTTVGTKVIVMPSRTA